MLAQQQQPLRLRELTRLQAIQVHPARPSHPPNDTFNTLLNILYFVLMFANSMFLAHRDDALEALQGLVRELERLNVSAAKSLLEGLEETITIHRLEIPEVLRRSFATTNILESCYSRSRSTMHNVKRWRNSQHKARWIATALLEAERSFRHIKGYRSMSVLTSALERHTKKNIQQAA